MAQLTGSDVADTLVGTSGDDTILGAGGDDRIVITRGNDSVDGGSGNDTLYASESDIASWGITGSSSRSFRLGGGQFVDGTQTVSTWFNNIESFHFFDRTSGDVVFDARGFQGTASIYLQGVGNKTIYGGNAGGRYGFGPGINNFSAVAGPNDVSVTPNDINTPALLTNGPNGTIVFRQGGDSTTLSQVQTVAISPSLSSTGLDLTLDRIDTAFLVLVFGSSATDRIVGSSKYEYFFIQGSATDSDSITGGPDGNAYYITNLSRVGSQGKITDFTTADLINFSNATAAGGTFIGTDPFSGRAGEIRYQIDGNNTLLQIDSDGNGQADQLLTLVSGGLALTLSDPGMLQGIPSARGTIVGTDQGEKLSGTPAADSISALGGNDIIEGTAGRDTIDGGAGDDTLTYLFNSVGYGLSLSPYARQIIVNPDSVYDSFGQISTGFTSIERIRLVAQSTPSDRGFATNVATIDASRFGGLGVEVSDPNSGDRTITGSAGDDYFSLAAGGGTIDGGGGVDILYLRAIGGGTLKQSGADWVLDGPKGVMTIRNIELLSVEAAGGGLLDARALTADGRFYAGAGAFVLAGSGNDQLFALGDQDGGGYLAGGAGNDTLTGGRGADTLQGGTGQDSMAGGLGDDVYVVDTTGDVVVEKNGEGRDTVLAEASYTLASNTEVEVLSTSVNNATSTMTLGGNVYAQVIVGDYGNNILIGGGTSRSGDQNDVLIGLRGDDSYVVDSVRTVVIENPGEGADVVTVSASASNFVLNAATSVETLQATSGTDSINITGNPDAQVLIGNEGANILSGAGGGDTLIGRGGNDTYQVRSMADQVIEANGGGNDTVFATVSYSLGANEVEALSTVVQAATDPINLIGNYATQVIIGNYGNNILNGGSGGLDTLIGLFGDDTYAVGDARVIVIENAGQGNDTVVTSVSYQLRNGASVETLAAQNRAGTDVLVLTGNGTAQLVAGNDGANTLDGRGGADTLIGGGGADVFAFTTSPTSGNADTIADFQAGVDRIGLASDVFAAVTDGGIQASELALGTAAQDGDDRLVYDQATGRLFYDADGNGSGAAVLIAQLAAGTTLTATSFVVVSPVSDLVP